MGYHVRYLERPVTVETDEIKTAKITNCILVYLIFNKKIFLEVNYKFCILIDMVHRLAYDGNRVENERLRIKKSYS